MDLKCGGCAANKDFDDIAIEPVLLSVSVQRRASDVTHLSIWLLCFRQSSDMLARFATFVSKGWSHKGVGRQ